MKDILNDNDPLKAHTKKPLLKVIREKCLDCCMGQPSEVRKCHILDCPLWPYRMGRSPFRRRTMNDEQIKKATRRLKTNK